MYQKQRLIVRIDEILKSKTSALSEVDRRKLKEVKEALKKAKTNEQILRALGPIASIFRVIIEVLSG